MKELYGGTMLNYYRVSHERNGVYQSLIIAANDEEDAKEKYMKAKPDGRIVGISAMLESELNESKRKGMPILNI